MHITLRDRQRERGRELEDHEEIDAFLVNDVFDTSTPNNVPTWGAPTRGKQREDEGDTTGRLGTFINIQNMNVTKLSTLHTT